MRAALSTIALVSGLGLGLAGAGWAASQADAEAAEGVRPGKQMIREACQDDIARMCSGTGGRAATLGCLEDNQASLTPECRVAVEGRLDRIERRMNELIGACQADIDALCGGDVATLHRGEIFQCLDANRDSLSDVCTAAFGGAHGGHRMHGKHGCACGDECGGECRGECTGECAGGCGRECGGGGCGPCHAEFERLCPDAADHRALHACVEGKQAELSAECRTHFAECPGRRRGQGDI